jgi:hypothetical protein
MDFNKYSKHNNSNSIPNSLRGYQCSLSPVPNKVGLTIGMGAA